MSNKSISKKDAKDIKNKLESVRVVVDKKVDEQRLKRILIANEKKKMAESLKCVNSCFHIKSVGDGL